MKIKQLLFIIIAPFLLSSCLNSIDGNGEVTNETRKVKEFNKIDISGAYEIILNQGEVEALELEVDENLLALIETKVKGKTLKISTEGTIGRAESLKVYITVVNLKEIDISGAAEIKNKGKLTCKKLKIDASGASDIELNIDADDLEMELSGASETALNGHVENFEIELSGAGELDAQNLETETTTIDISGAGSAIVFAKEQLQINVSGAGSVKYKGNPQVNKSVSGAGSISRL